MTFLHQSSLLWLLAWAALAFFTLSVGWLIISAVWRLWRNPFVTTMKDSNLLKLGEPEAFLTPAKKSIAVEIAKGMLLLAAILGAYDIGTKAEYSKEYAAWKVRQTEWQKEHAAWLARHSKEMTNGQSQLSLAR